MRAIRGRSARREQAVFFRSHRVGDVIDEQNGITGAGFAQHRDAAGNVVALHEIDRPRKFLEPGFDRQAQPFEVVELNRIVSDQGREFVNVGKNGCGGGFVLSKEARLGGK